MGEEMVRVAASERERAANYKQSWEEHIDAKINQNNVEWAAKLAA
jgi:hypothetical protein